MIFDLQHYETLYAIAARSSPQLGWSSLKAAVFDTGSRLALIINDVRVSPKLKHVTMYFSTFTVPLAGTPNLSGVVGQVLSLRSSVTDTQWKIDPQGTRTVSYLDVKDSNNVNWSFVATQTIKKHQFYFFGF